MSEAVRRRIQAARPARRSALQGRCVHRPRGPAVCVWNVIQPCPADGCSSLKSGTPLWCAAYLPAKQLPSIPYGFQERLHRTGPADGGIRHIRRLVRRDRAGRWHGACGPGGMLPDYITRKAPVRRGSVPFPSHPRRPRRSPVSRRRGCPPPFPSPARRPPPAGRPPPSR